MKQIGCKIIPIVEGFCYKPPVGCFGYASVFLVKDENKNILFDTGAYCVRKEIINLLKKVHIDCVVISHLHFDHCSNLDLFKNSDTKILLSKLEFKSYFKNKYKDNDLFNYFDYIYQYLNLKFVKDNEQISPNCTIIFTPGHSIGHISLKIQDKEKTYLLCGDAIKSKKEKKHLNKNTNAYDYNLAVNTRKDILKRYKYILYGHDCYKKKLKLRRF